MISARRGPATGGLAFLVTAAIACGPAPLANAQASPDALAREVLSALAANDETRLRSLALNEEEFRRHVWPALPAARPERNLPFSYVWGDLRQKSDSRLAAMLAAHRGRTYQLSTVVFSEGVTEYGPFAVHRAAILRVRESGGAEREMRLFGSAIEQGGAWKVFSFNVDD